MKRWFVSIAAAVLIGLLSEPCFACSCVSMDPEQRRGWADVVFTGEVVDVRRRWELPLSEASAQALLSAGRSPQHGDSVGFKVDRVYKGGVHETQWVVGHGQEASCGFEFEVGRTYTVFARAGNGGQLRTGLCAGVFDDAFDPATFGLDSAQDPRPGTDMNDAHGYARWFLAVSVPGVAAILFFTGRTILRRMRPGARGT